MEINNDHILIKLYKIKQARLTPAERFLYDIVFDLKKYTSIIYSEKTYYKKNNQTLFEYDSKEKYLYYCYCIFYKLYQMGFSNKGILQLIKNIVCKTLNLNCIDIKCTSNFKNYKYEELHSSS